MAVSRLETRHRFHIPKAIGLLWQAAPGWSCLSAVLLALQAGLPLVQLYLMKLVVDGVTFAVGAADKEAAIGRVLLLIGLMGAATLASVLLSSAARVVGQAQAQVLTDHVQDMLHAQSVALDLAYYEDARFYDTLHRAQQEAPYRPTSIVNGVVNVFQNAVTLVAIAGLLFAVHWTIPAVLAASLAPGMLLRLKFSGVLFKWQSLRSTVDRAATYLNWMLTGQFYAKEIRVFDLGALFIERFHDLRDRLRREKIGIALRQATGELVAEAGAAAAILGCLAYIAYRTVQGAMTLGDMVMYYQAFQRGQAYLRQLLEGLAGLYEDNLYLSHFYDFLDLAPAITGPAREVPRPMKNGVVFDGVDFRYPTGDAMVLTDINLAIRPGQVVALVGENGSGKTTLAKLLCRFYDPTNGRITVDGIDLRDLEPTAWRHQFGVLFQDFAQYQMTAAENIRMGDIGLAPGDGKIAAAARRAGAHGVLEKLPKGYETMLGKWFGQGEELSVGQWQKVALARAFVRDAQIVVLDEPTSAMDPKAEFNVFNAVRELAVQRTVILISHRFSTIRMADRIVMLKDGRIIEDGTHDQLIDQGGQYAQLFRLQARYNR